MPVVLCQAIHKFTKLVEVICSQVDDIEDHSNDACTHVDRRVDEGIDVVNVLCFGVTLEKLFGVVELWLYVLFQFVAVFGHCLKFSNPGEIVKGFYFLI